MARLPFDEIGGLRHLRRFDSEAAAEFAALTSIKKDLELAGAAVRLLLVIFPKPIPKTGTEVPAEGLFSPSDFQISALMDSAVVRYRRAVRRGERRGCEAEIRARLPPDLLQAHEEALAFADHHTAHASRDFELPFVIVALTSDDPSTARATIVHAGVRSVYAWKLDKLETLRRLIDRAEATANELMSAAQRKVAAEVGELSSLELVSLPVVGPEGTDPPERRRHGS